MAPNRYYTSDAVPTTLAADLPAVSPGATGAVQVASITGYPVSYPFTLLIDRGTPAQEVVTVTQAATGTTGPFTYANCVRGDDGTAAPAHTVPTATVAHGVSARDFTDPQTHLAASTGVHGVTGGLAGLASPTLTGTPAAPTAAPGTSTTQVATTAFVAAAVTAAGGHSATTSLAFTSPITNGATAALTMTVTGAAAGQAVSLGVPATFNAGLIAYGFVSAASTVTVVIANLSGADVTPGTISVTAEVR